MRLPLAWIPGKEREDAEEEERERETERERKAGSQILALRQEKFTLNNFQTMLLPFLKHWGYRHYAKEVSSLADILNRF